MSRRPIYLDYAAATPLDERVLQAMQPYLTEKFYNPSSLYQDARNVRSEYESARHQIAQTIGAKQHEIVMTAGATESCNLAVHGVIGHYGGRVATAPTEHHAILETAKMHEFDLISVTPQGLTTVDAVQQAITDQTSLISVGYVNNELGTVQPLSDIARLVNNIRQDRMRRGVSLPLLLHTDASQALGLLNCNVSRLGVDLMTLNAAKCYGPKQVGVLWVRGGLMLNPLVSGGGQELGLRSGTEHVAGTIGCAEAFTIAVSERKNESYRLGQLRDRLQMRLENDIEGIVVNGHPKRRSPHILHVSLDGLDGERVVFALDEHGIMAATGSACAANHGTRSHVLKAIGMSDSLADGSLRFTVGRHTTEELIDEAASIIVSVISKERIR